MTEGLPPAPSSADVAAVGALRDGLLAAGYTGAAVRAITAPSADAPVVPRRGDVPVVVRRLPAGTPMATLVALFVLDLEVAEHEVVTALGPDGAAAAVRLGVVGPAEGGGVVARVRLVPSGKLLLASDRPGPDDQPRGPEHVLGVSQSSVTLANLTMRRPVERLLDVGTGCGIQALLGARHAREVVATDVNPRALEFTAFNARLNAVDGIDLRLGPLLEPVAGERFDQVIANPPFVVSPESSYAFRDGGCPGDEFCRALVTGAPDVLADGGTSQILVNALQPRGAGPYDRIRGWVEGRGCDAWLLHLVTDDVLSYAGVWNDALAPDPARFGDALDRWAAYFDGLDVEAITYAAVLLRKRTGRNWTRTQDVGSRTVRPAGRSVRRLFETRDDDAALGVDAVLAVQPGHRLTVELRPEGDGYAVAGASVVGDEGLPGALPVPADAVPVLRALDGRRSVAAVLDGAPEDADVEAVLDVLRTLIELGVLVRR